MEKTPQSIRTHHQNDTVRDDFDFDGRQVRVVLPAALANGHTKGHRQFALVLALVGFGVTGEEMLRAPGLGVGLGVLPGMDDVIVAAPDGSIHPVLGQRFWNGAECCGFEALFGPQVDDVKYLTRLTDELLRRYPIDARRVYVVGHSNGGTMIHRLACDVPDRYAAFVAMSGNTYYNIEDCGLDQKIHLLQIQGTADPVNLLEGGSFPVAPDTPYPGTIGTVERVAALVGCQGHLVRKGRLDLESRLFSGHSRRETQVSGYTGCRGATVDLWLIKGGGHLWFLSCDPTVESDCGAFEATDSRTSIKIWQWVKRFRKNLPLWVPKPAE
jgi:polyhydroxybutyrate depolymerase